MVDLLTQTVLTPNGAANELQSTGLDALGLTIPNLSPVWAASTPVASAYDSSALTLQVTGLKAPFRSIREFLARPTLYSGLDGRPLPGPAAVLRLHPEAARRLGRLVDNRLGTSPAIHPVPVALVARGITMPDPVDVPEWFFAADPVDFTGAVTISFHDARGLIIDPIAVACLFRELLSFRPALNVTSGGTHTVADAGGLDGIAALASGTLVHVVDPHGWGYVPTRDKARLKVLDATNNEISPVPDGGLVTLNTNQALGRSAADDTADGTNRPLRWGFATNAALARTRLTPPALPAGVTLARQFFRVMAVDLDWHLVGNRTAPVVPDVPSDTTVPEFLLPAVRDPVPSFAYLADPQDVVGSAAAMISGFGTDPSTVAVAVSPVLDETLRAPPQPGTPGHWPAFPSFAAPQPISPTTNPRQGATAVRRAAADGAGADRDVILTIAAGTVPDGAHVRVFPRLFQQIMAIGNTPSFIRPDGGAAIVQSGAATKVLLVNPFGLRAADPFPDPANLAVDMVVTDRNGRRRLFSQTTIAVTAGPESAVDNLASFGGNSLLGTSALEAALDSGGTRSIASAALFGLPRTTPLPGITTDPAAFIRAMANETQPREGPRLPTMMRFESILATGTSPTTDTPLRWNAVLSGVRFNLEARSFRADLGNPGNPAGADVMATGVRAGGFLARDLAVHAIKRAQPIVPLGGGIKGWVIETGRTTWNTPAADTTGSIAAVMLETVAAICDTPELAVSVVPDPQPDDDPQTLVNQVTTTLGTSTVPVPVTSAVDIVRRVQREIVTAKHGQRDALWSLCRACKQAREFIYIESPAFAVTVRPATPPAAHELVQMLVGLLESNPRLKLMICTPRLPDFAPDKQGWVRTAFKHRKDALELLISRARALADAANEKRARVAAFHPIGFPGRSSPLRTTTIIVDDVYCLVGTSHFRRRGMTFDGAVDIASIDRQISRGYSAATAQFRQKLMAQRLGVDVPTSPTNSSALWTRLAQPESAFGAVADLLDAGGEGRLTPVFAGPDDTAVLPQTDDVADPDGTSGASFATFIAAALIGE